MARFKQILVFVLMGSSVSLAALPAHAGGRISTIGSPHRGAARQTGRGRWVSRAGTVFTLKQKDVDTLLSREGLKDLSREVGVRKHSEGFRISSVNSYSFVRKMGLRHGDVIQKVNGYEVGNEAEALRAYMLLKNKKSWTLEFLRAGKVTTYQYQVK